MSSFYKRYFIILIVGFLLLVALIFSSIMMGVITLSMEQLIAIFITHDLDIPPMLEQIVLNVRAPRVLLAIFTGAGLAMVGGYLQTITRNQLADPFLFGLSSGASVGAVIVITRLGDLGIWSLPLAAFAGGILSSLAVLILFSIQMNKMGDRLIICGVAMSFLFGAATSYLVFSGDQRAVNSILFWSLGGLGRARWDNIMYALSAVMLLLILLGYRWRELDALLAGEQTAQSLGVSVTRLRIEVFISCALATSLLVALTGVIGFVGLMVPHLAKGMIYGASHKYIIPLTALLGAVMLLGGDLLSRWLIVPQELPLGIVTAALGSMFILSLLIKRR